MTWTITTTPPQGGSTSATVRNPDLGDRWRTERRQAAAETDGGQVFVQDLGLEDRFLEAGWSNLNPQEWSDLIRVFRAAGWRARSLTIVISPDPISGPSPFPVELNTGLTIAGVELNTGAAACFDPNTGDTVLADEATLAGVFLDTSQAQFDHQRDLRADLALRFRIADQAILEAGG